MKQHLSKRLKLGSYSLALCAAALVAVVFLNAIVSALPVKYTQIDTTSSSLTEIGEASVGVASGIKEDVTLYLVATSGAEDSVVRSLLRRYTEVGKHLKLELVDPAVRPTFLTSYGAESAGENSIVVVNNSGEGRYRVIDGAALYQYYIAEMGQYFDYETASRYYTMYANLYGKILTVTRYFRGEQLITSALDYVTSEELPGVYVLTGHGETALPEALLERLRSDNLEVTTDYNLLLAGEMSLPADCRTVIINLPTVDLDPAEADLLLSFMENDGTVLLVTGYSEQGVSGMKNLMRVAAAMGLAPEDGFLGDEDKDHYTAYNGRYYALLPKIGNDGPFHLLDGAGKTFLILSAHGIKPLEEYSGRATLLPILTTTEKGYVKKGTGSGVSKEEGDVEGQFHVGVAACLPDEDGDGSVGTFLWYASQSIENELYANCDLFVASVNWMSGRASSVSIAYKEAEVAYLDAFSQNEIGLWSALMIFALPGCFLGGGLAIWLRRRRK